VAGALSPLVRRIVAPNPGPFTGPGTNTYLVGIDEVAVIDPGPDDEGHVDAIVGAATPERVKWVLLTHFHPDHVPATARLVARTGAEVLASTRRLPRDATAVVDRVLRDGDTVEGTEFGLEALVTPGHAPEHLCFLLEEERTLFTGDVVLGGMYSVINPGRGGDMAVYLETLQRLERLRLTRIAPAHGDAIDEPRAAIRDYLDHRAAREAQIVALVAAQPRTVAALVADVYGDSELPPELVTAAGWQVLAHLQALKAAGRVTGTARSRWHPA